jgi:hypothetical protein
MYKVVMQKVGRKIVQSYADLYGHGNLPGYSELPWRTRCILNVRSLGCFLCSGECLRLVSYLLVWLLAGFNIVWQLDLHDSAAALPLLLACLWVCPWVASARRRWVCRLLADT